MTTRMRRVFKLMEEQGTISAERLAEVTGWRLQTARASLYNLHTAGYATSEHVYTMTDKGKARSEELANAPPPRPRVTPRGELDRRRIENEYDAETTVQMAIRTAPNSIFNWGAMV